METDVGVNDRARPLSWIGLAGGTGLAVRVGHDVAEQQGGGVEAVVFDVHRRGRRRTQPSGQLGRERDQAAPTHGQRLAVVEAVDDAAGRSTVALKTILIDREEERRVLNEQQTVLLRKGRELRKVGPHAEEMGDDQRLGPTGHRLFAGLRGRDERPGYEPVGDQPRPGRLHGFTHRIAHQVSDQHLVTGADAVLREHPRQSVPATRDRVDDPSTRPGRSSTERKNVPAGRRTGQDVAQLVQVYVEPDVGYHPGAVLLEAKRRRVG